MPPLMLDRYYYNNRMYYTNMDKMFVCGCYEHHTRACPINKKYVLLRVKKLLALLKIRAFIVKYLINSNEICLYI